MSLKDSSTGHEPGYPVKAIPQQQFPYLLVHANPNYIPACGGSWFCFVNLFVILLDESLAVNRFVLTLVIVFSSNGD